MLTVGETKDVIHAARHTKDVLPPSAYIQKREKWRLVQMVKIIAWGKQFKL
jgi:hypothetical protein